MHKKGPTYYGHYITTGYYTMRNYTTNGLHTFLEKKLVDKYGKYGMKRHKMIHMIQ